MLAEKMPAEKMPAEKMPAENPYAGQGAVLLDIGGDIGALVVTVPASMVGTEVEIRALGSEQAHYQHVAVVSRPVAAGRVPSLVYGELAAGRYELAVLPAGPVAMTVTVAGGRVTEAAWPG